MANYGQQQHISRLHLHLFWRSKIHCHLFFGFQLISWYSIIFQLNSSKYWETVVSSLYLVGCHLDPRIFQRQRIWKFLMVFSIKFLRFDITSQSMSNLVEILHLKSLENSIFSRALGCTRLASKLQRIYSFLHFLQRNENLQRFFLIF